jgi:hypothetical protein
MAEASSSDHYADFLKSIGATSDDKSALNAYKFNPSTTASKRSVFGASKLGKST